MLKAYFTLFENYNYLHFIFKIVLLRFQHVQHVEIRFRFWCITNTETGEVFVWQILACSADRWNYYQKSTVDCLPPVLAVMVLAKGFSLFNIGYNKSSTKWKLRTIWAKFEYRLVLCFDIMYVQHGDIQMMNSSRRKLLDKHLCQINKIFQPTIDCTSIIKFKASVRSRTQF